MGNFALLTPPPVESGVTISGLLHVVRRRRTAGLVTLGVFILLAALATMSMTRRYTVSGTVQVRGDGAAPTEVADLGGPPANLDAGLNVGLNMGHDATAPAINQQTQVNILQSGTLALGVIKRLNLEQTFDDRQYFGVTGPMVELLIPKPAPGPAGAGVDSSSSRRGRALREFSSNLKVQAVPGTSLVRIEYSDPDPQLAAAAVNQLIQGLTDFAHAAKAATNAQADEWLNAQLIELQTKSEDDQERLVELQKSADLFSLGTDPQGHDQMYSEALDKLQRSTAALSAATQDRIVKESVLKAARRGDSQLLSQLSVQKDGQNGATRTTNPPALMQNLRFSKAAIERQVADAKWKYGAAYPRAAELHAALEKVDQEIIDETARIAARARSEFDIAEQTENEMRALNDANRRAAELLRDNSVQYSLLRDQATQSRSLYGEMLRKVNEAAARKRLRGNDLTVVDPGRVPDRPSWPNLPLNLEIGAALGLLFGVGGMFLAEAMDVTIQTISQVEELGVPLIGVLPRYGDGHAALEGLGSLRTLNAPKSAYSEAVRSVRASLVAPTGPGPHRVIVVTSAAPGEGKSLTARNLAVSVAQQGKRVVLVDADFRSRAGDGADFSAKDGLSTVLSGAQGGPSLLQVANLPTLFLLPSGAMPPNPAELLGSARMKSLIDELRTQFEVVLIDSPPVLPVVDTILLSGMSDSIVLVVRPGETEQKSLSRAHQLLSARARRDSIGVVLNAVSTKSEMYRSWFGRTADDYYEEEVRVAA